MELLKHRNDIEIKLLPNRRFIYSNRRQNIVITAEHSATEITVQYPEEYENYSKRVDFVNSKGKEWTEALYIPEYKKYKGGFSKTRFHFTLPTEVTTEGELKMQFIAYKPDKSMTTVPFEVIPIDVLDGVLAFKKNARSNPDLLILSYNQSAEALFNSQRAVAKSEKAEKISKKAEEQSREAVETANRTEADLATEIERATTAENNLQAALDSEIERAQNAEATVQANLDAEVERATQAEADITAALNTETAEREAAIGAEAEARIAGDALNAEAIAAETLRAQTAESDLAASLAAETERATAAEETNAQAIAAETERAVAAEQALAEEIQRTESDFTAALNTETAARIQGDADNAAAIQAETLRAQGAESVITADLAAETQRAQTAEQINADAIAAETTRAQDAESALQSAIAAEQARAIDAENNLHSALTSESSRAMQAEALLTAELNSEIERAKTAEQINEAAISAEETRATQAEAALGARIDTEVPAAMWEAKEYADQVAQQVRIDGTIYRGTVKESELPWGENGDLYWISDFDITKPDHSGSAVFNGMTYQWDFNIDRYKHQDNDTIVARDSDGALKVADTEEINLMPDTADFGGTVQLGFKAMIRSIIRKIKGLFQRATDNASAISAETSRAQTAESALSSSISAEVTRAQAAEQINANAIQAETQRATAAENNLSGRITAEESRAQTAESGLSSRITAEEARAKTAEQANAAAIATEVARAQAAEGGLAAAIAAEETARQNGDAANAQAIAAETTRAQTAEAGKVDKVAGKGLSTEDYTTTEKSKLAGIAAGANNYTHPTSHPPSIIAQDVNNRFVSDSEKAAWNNKAEKTAATQTADGLMSAADKTKLDNCGGSSGGGGGDGIPICTTSGTSPNLIINSAEIKIPLVNGTPFIIIPHTSSSGTVTLSVNGLPAKQIYRVSIGDMFMGNVGSRLYGTTKDRPLLLAYDESRDHFAALNRPLVQWEELSNCPVIMQAKGTSTFDLMSQKVITDELNKKMDKVAGKDFSTEDYTTEEKQKLASLEKNHAKPTTEYGVASKVNYGHSKFYGNANGDSTELLANPTWEHYYNSAFDCNDYKTAGRIYQNHNRSGAGATENGPLGNTIDRFCLEVYTIPAETTTVLQRYISMHYGREFIRKYNGVWSAWQEIAFVSNIPTTPAGIGAEPAFNKNTAFNKNFGTAAGTVCDGNDSRLSNSRPPTAHTHNVSEIYGLDGDYGSGGGNGVEYAFIQLAFDSEELGASFMLQTELLVPNLRQLAEQFVGEGFFEKIAASGFKVEDETERQIVEELFVVLAGMGGNTSVTFIIGGDGLVITTPLTCAVAVGKGIAPVSFSARLFGDEIDLIEFLGDAEHTGTYVTPNSGGTLTAAMLGLI